MARIAGVDIPNEKRIEVALTYVYGIGPAKSLKILNGAGINIDTRVKDLSLDVIGSPWLLSIGASRGRSNESIAS